MCNGITIDAKLAGKIFSERGVTLRRFLHTYLAVGTDYKNISEFILDYAESVGYQERQIWKYWAIIKPIVGQLRKKKPTYVRIHVRNLMF